MVKYLKQTNQNEDFTNYDIDHLDKMLGSFWFAMSPEKQGSEHYTVSSLHHIRYAIKRILQNSGKEYDITTDPRFSNSQRLFKEACKELKRKGFGHVKHTDAIKASGKFLHWQAKIVATSNPSFTKKYSIPKLNILHKHFILKTLWNPYITPNESFLIFSI